MPPEPPGRRTSLFSDLPRHAKVLVHAAVLGVGVSGALGCGSVIHDAPTCGPCCHDPHASCGPGGEQEITLEERARQIEAERLEQERQQRELEEQRRLEEERRARESDGVSGDGSAGGGAGDGSAGGGDTGGGTGGLVEAVDPAPGPRAPTCGPCCHGYNGPECGGSTPIQPEVDERR